MTDTPESAIVMLLRADAGFIALAGDRVWPGERPQGHPFPAATVTRITGGPEYADDGEAGLMQSRIQVSCWGLSYSDAKELAIAVTNALTPGHQVTAGAITFSYILLDNEQDLHEFGAGNAEYPMQTALDFLVMSER